MNSLNTIFDIPLLMELMDTHLTNGCKTIKGKHYNLITNSQLKKIIEDYIDRKNFNK